MTNTIEKFNQFHDEAEMMDRVIETEQDKIDYLKFRFGDKMLGEEIRELIEGIKDNDSHEILDGAGDVIFIAVNTVHFLGVKNIIKDCNIEYLVRYLIKTNHTTNTLISAIDYDLSCLDSIDSVKGKEVSYNSICLLSIIECSFTIMVLRLISLGYTQKESIAYVWTILDCIADANLAKRHKDGKFHKVNGKIIKPEGWKEPRFDDIIEGKNVR